MPQARLERSGPMYWERKSNKGLLAASFFVGASLFAAAIHAIPSESAPTSQAKPENAPSLSPSVSQRNSALNELLLNLQPGTRVFERLKALHVDHGIEVNELQACTDQDGTIGIEHKVVNNVQLREGPSQNSKALGELTTDQTEPLRVALRVSVSTKKVTKGEFVREWVGLVDSAAPIGDQVVFAAREQGITSYLLPVEDGSCVPVRVPEILNPPIQK